MLAIERAELQFFQPDLDSGFHRNVGRFLEDRKGNPQETRCHKMWARIEPRAHNLLIGAGPGPTGPFFIMWRGNLRDDILEWVDPIDCSGGVAVYDIWINPRTGDDVWRCPWLRKLPKKRMNMFAGFTK